MPSFKYLVRILTAGINNWPAVAGNLGKARKSWGRLKWILIREGADKRVLGTFFKAVVQQILLFWGRYVVGDANNEAGVELFHAWGCKTDHG